MQLIVINRLTALIYSMYVGNILNNISINTKTISKMLTRLSLI